MNTEERRLLVQLLDALIAAAPEHKDSEADALIRQACERQPDACYLLAHRALQLARALAAAEAELERRQQPHARAAGALLGNAAHGGGPGNGGRRDPAAMGGGSFLLEGVQASLDGQRAASRRTGAPEPVVLNEPGAARFADDRDAGWDDGGDFA